MQNLKALKVNDDFSAQSPQLIQAISGGKIKRLKIKKFVFLNINSVKKMSAGEYMTWKPPRLRNEGKRKFIELYYRVPAELPEELQTKYGPPGSWHRFRIFQNVNHRHSSPELVQQLLAKLVLNLENGYSPFDEEAAEFRRIKAMVAEEQKAKKQLITVNAAADAFLAQYDEKSNSAYAVIVSFLKKHLTKKASLNENIWYQSIELITAADLTKMLVSDLNDKHWSPNTYNDKVKKLVTFFNFCMEQGYIAESPAAALGLLTKGTTVKHTPFEDDIIADVKKAIKEVPYWGQHLHNFCEMIYYSCTRPDQETRQLQIKHILWGRHIIDIPNEIAKGGNGRDIFMVPELEALFNRMELKSFPPDYYIFGKEGPPGPEPTSQAHYSNLFRKEVREPKKLSPKLTNYSWKHTRCIHMWLANSGLAAIQQLCGHSKPSMTEEYLSKGLGLMLGNVTHNVSKSF